MARHEIRSAKPRPAKPKAEIRAAPSFYERTHPVGSAERFLDEAAKEALVAAAAGGLAEPRQLAAGAVKAIAKKASEYPDPLLQRAAELPAAELAKRAARAEAYNQAMQTQNRVAEIVSASLSPVSDIARTQAATAIAGQQDVKGGRTVHAAQGSQQAEPPMDAEVPAEPSPDPRIVINPKVFEDRRDALCVAFNEAFRVVMEDNGFEPVSEPTDRQRRFFADTAYADDEVQLRRTILARIATLDTSVSDPTDEQLQETAEMLEMVMEVGAPQNEWERRAVQRLHDVVVKAREGHVQNAEEPPPQDETSVQSGMRLPGGE